jgi:hypothetical protein
VLPRPFYLTDVLIAPDLIQSLLSIRRFTTDNSSMQFDAFGLFGKDLAKRSVIARYNSYGSLYTLRLPASTTSITPWLLLLPLLPGVIVSVTLTPTSSPSYRVVHFFLEYTGELRIIALRRKKEEGPKHAAPVLSDRGNGWDIVQ